jgi:hypothetical protein
LEALPSPRGFVLYRIWLVVAYLENLEFLAFAKSFPNDEALA